MRKELESMTTPSPEYEAREIVKLIIDGWCLPGMTIGWQIKNGCLEGDMISKIASALKQRDEKIQRLKDYVEHSFQCTNSYEKKWKCTCGLKELLEEA
jgi:hypothetical protein